jgi:hypothetical protein
MQNCTVVSQGKGRRYLKIQFTTRRLLHKHLYCIQSLKQEERFPVYPVEVSFVTLHALLLRHLFLSIYKVI